MHPRAFPPLFANQLDRSADSSLDLAELLARATAAINQALEQIHKTQALLAEYKGNRQSATTPNGEPNAALTLGKMRE